MSGIVVSRGHYSMMDFNGHISNHYRIDVAAGSCHPAAPVAERPPSNAWGAAVAHLGRTEGLKTTLRSNFSLNDVKLLSSTKNAAVSRSRDPVVHAESLGRPASPDLERAHQNNGGKSRSADTEEGVGE